MREKHLLRAHRHSSWSSLLWWPHHSWRHTHSWMMRWWHHAHLLLRSRWTLKRLHSWRKHHSHGHSHLHHAWRWHWHPSHLRRKVRRLLARHLRYLYDFTFIIFLFCRKAKDLEMISALRLISYVFILSKKSKERYMPK